MTRAKICGIMTPTHAHTAIEAGASFIGLVFAPSRRQISVNQAQEVVAAARKAVTQRSVAVEMVGVFVNETPEAMNNIAAQVGLDRIQLSGHEAPSIISSLHLPVVKAIRFDEDAGETDWLALAETAKDRLSLLVDAHVPGSYGGAGIIGDWQRAAELASHCSLWLAGGLTPANVAMAIQAVQPAVVDVSSGVETNGFKDHAKIQAFVLAAKQVYHQE
jgi:phosphoribosylanthranilate isomerase